MVLINRPTIVNLKSKNQLNVTPTQILLNDHKHLTICHRAFQRQSSLTRHKKVHVLENPYKCDICNVKSFSNSKELNIHQRYHTSEINDQFNITRKLYKCDHCGQWLQTYKGIVNHLLEHTH